MTHLLLQGTDDVERRVVKGRHTEYDLHLIFQCARHAPNRLSVGEYMPQHAASVGIICTYTDVEGESLQHVLPS